MSAPFYQDELKSQVTPAKATEQRKSVGIRWMYLPFLALLVASFNLGGAVAENSFTDTINGYQQVIRGYQARIAELSQDGATTSSLPVCPPGQFWSSKYNECLENKVNQKPPLPPVNRPPVGAPTGPAENVPPPAPAPNPIPTMPPAPTVDGAPGPDN